MSPLSFFLRIKNCIVLGLRWKTMVIGSLQGQPLWAEPSSCPRSDQSQLHLQKGPAAGCGDPCWSSLLLKDDAPLWCGAILEQCFKSCSLWGGQFRKGVIAWEGSHMEQGQRMEEWQRLMIKAPFPVTLHCLGREGVGEDEWGRGDFRLLLISL